MEWSTNLSFILILRIKPPVIISYFQNNGGNRFGSDNEIIAQTYISFQYLHEFYYLEALKKLEKRWLEVYGVHTLRNNTFFDGKAVFHSKSHELYLSSFYC